jgi:hypothetical protein
MVESGWVSDRVSDMAVRSGEQDSRKGQSWRWPPIQFNSTWLARDIVPAPGRHSKCADARRRNAGTAVSITGGEGGARIGVFCEVPRGCHMALPSHSGSCERSGGDQRS